MNTLAVWFSSDVWWSYLLRIILFFGVAALIHRASWLLAGRMVRLRKLTRQGRRSRPERLHTLRGLIASTIGFLAYSVACVATLSLFVRLDTLVWVLGLFSAAFGLAARPLISDLMAGISLIFEDTLAVGEKVEIMDVEGIVEEVNLRTTLLRAPTGELYIVPNGDVRVVRNFSRGKFSTANVRLGIAAGDLTRALEILQDLGSEAMSLLPDLLEPWQVISESGLMGEGAQLTLVAKARFGRAAELRPRLLALVQGRFSEMDIRLIG